MSHDKAALVLEDGTVFAGRPFGAAGEATGETVLYTGVVGYQEVLTNPSFRGTIAVMTYPIIGAYGVNGEDHESPEAQARGIVVREYSPYYSNFRATGALGDYLRERGIVGVCEVDTRAVAVHLREKGEMRGAIVAGDADAKRTAEKLKAAPSPYASDLVGEISRAGRAPAAGRGKRRIAVLDLGAKRSLLAQLAALGCAVVRMKATASARDILAKKARGVIVAGGPGDPRAATYAVETVRGLLGKTPLLGIGLGHQVLALALGCRVRRMKIGHHGVNYPVRERAGGGADITVQHHSFVVDEEGVADGVEVTHTNLNDGSIEGIGSAKRRAWGVQFHPSPDEMERPSEVLARFCGATKRGKK